MEKESFLTGEELDNARRNSDIDLIRRGASYEIKHVPDSLVEKLESEHEGELFPDVAGFIGAKREIVCPKEELGEASEEFKDKEGTYFVDQQEGVFYYIDRGGNIASFVPNRESIISIDESMKSTSGPCWSCVVSEMDKIAGFKRTCDTVFYRIVFKAVKEHKIKTEEEAKQKEKSEFNF